MTAFTPPSHLDGPSNGIDVNSKGPGCMTAVHLAAMHGNGLDKDEDLPASTYGHVMAAQKYADDGQGGLIHDLILQNPELIDQQCEPSGETALHIAARYASTAAARILLYNQGPYG